MNAPPGFVDIRTAAGKMGMTLAEALAHAHLVEGCQCISESEMHSLAAARSALAKEEHFRAARGELEQGQRKY